MSWARATAVVSPEPSLFVKRDPLALGAAVAGVPHRREASSQHGRNTGDQTLLLMLESGVLRLCFGERFAATFQLLWGRLGDSYTEICRTAVSRLYTKNPNQRLIGRTLSDGLAFALPTMVLGVPACCRLETRKADVRPHSSTPRCWKSVS